MTRRRVSRKYGYMVEEALKAARHSRAGMMTARELLAEHGEDWSDKWPWLCFYAEGVGAGPEWVAGPDTRGKCLHCENVYADEVPATKTLGDLVWDGDLWLCGTRGCDGMLFDFMPAVAFETT